MAMILMIDELSKRYGLLPSEAIARASTFDIWVMDCALSFHKYHEYKQSHNGKAPVPQYSTDELKSMLARNRKDVKG